MIEKRTEVKSFVKHNDNDLLRSAVAALNPKSAPAAAPATINQEGDEHEMADLINKPCYSMTSP